MIFEGHGVTEFRGIPIEVPLHFSLELHPDADPALETQAAMALSQFLMNDYVSTTIAKIIDGIEIEPGE